MVSAIMARLAAVGHAARIVVVGDKSLGPRPFGENGKEAGDVLGDLPGVLAAKIAAQARCPELARPFNEIVVCCVR